MTMQYYKEQQEANKAIDTIMKRIVDTGGSMRKSEMIIQIQLAYSVSEKLINNKIRQYEQAGYVELFGDEIVSKKN